MLVILAAPARSRTLKKTLPECKTAAKPSIKPRMERFIPAPPSPGGAFETPPQHASGPGPVPGGGQPGKHLPAALDLGRLEEPKRLRVLSRTNSNRYSETIRRSPDRCENRRGHRILVQ